MSIVSLSPSAMLFVADDGSAIVCFKQVIWNHGELAMKKAGEKAFSQLHITRIDRDPLEKIYFENIQDGTRGEFCWTPGPTSMSIVMGDKVFRRQKDMPEQIELIELPSRRRYPLSSKAQFYAAADGQEIVFAGGWLDVLYSPDGKTYHELYEHGRSQAGLVVDDYVDGFRSRSIWREGDDFDRIVLGGEQIGHLRRSHDGSDDIGKHYVNVAGEDFVLDAEALQRHGLTEEQVVGALVAKTAENRHDGPVRRFDDALIVGGMEMHRATEAPPAQVDFLALPRVMHEPDTLLRLDDGHFVYISRDRYRSGLQTIKLFVGAGDAMREVEVLHDKIRLLQQGMTVIPTVEQELRIPLAVYADREPTWGEASARRCKLDDFKIVQNDDGVVIAPKNQT